MNLSLSPGFINVEAETPNRSIKLSFLALFVGLLVPLTASGQARWFQVEVSVFSNESLADRAEELWQAESAELEFPEDMRRLQTLLDMLFMESLLPQEGSDLQATNEDSEPEALLAAQLGNYGPEPRTSGTGFRVVDFQRDSFLQLPSRLSDFQQTNRALERSAEHRLLFHGLWRQPVENTANAIPVFVSGGEIFGDHPELQGSITIRFNDNRDRVVIDADLWLTEFSTVPLQTAAWELPLPPAGFLPLQAQSRRDSNNVTWHPIQVYHMQQSREMRSTEFHYLDHPALGLVIEVNPYDVPPRAVAEPDF